MAKKKKRIRHVESEGIFHISATFNNTIITVADKKGNAILWASGGTQGFKGSRKSTPYAAGIAAKKCAMNVKSLGMRSAEIWIKGPGAGRDTAVRAIKATGLNITAIRDKTPIPHNGCRPPKPRKV